MNLFLDNLASPLVLAFLLGFAAQAAGGNIRLAETVRETIATAIQANLSMVAIEDSDVTKRLAAWAGIFAAATAFAGIWGMNFEWMPELKWQWGYPAALGLITAVCVGLWWRFKRAGWL